MHHAADAQTDQHVGLGITRRQHEHGHPALTLHVAAHLKAVDAWQHQVEDHQIGPDAAAQGDAVTTVVCDLDLEAVRPQAGGDRGGDHLLVLDDGDAGL